MVSFGKDGQALFSADALLVLRKPGDIQFDALRDARQMETSDFKDLMQVMLLANSPLTKDHRLAMEMARENQTLMEYSLSPLEEELGLRQNYALER